MTTDTMSELISFFSSRWSELKAKEKQLKNVLLTNNSFAFIGGAYVSNVLRAQQLDPHRRRRSWTGCRTRRRRKLF